MTDDIHAVFAPAQWAEFGDVPLHLIEELTLNGSHASAAMSPASSLGAALQRVHEHLDPGEDHWLWLLSPAHVPQPGCLMALADVARGSSRVAIVGPKLVDAADRRRIVTVGHRMTSWGRSGDFTTAGVFDQGQCDETTDVIGVPVTGMLIRCSALIDIGGVQSALDIGVAGLDLSWRAHAQGHRVLAAPHAVVSHDVAASGALGHWDPRADAVDQRRVAAHNVSLALARTAWWRLPFRAVAMFLVSLTMTLGWALARRPKAAALALREMAALASVGRVITSRRKGTGHRVREADLQGLFYPLRGSLRRQRYSRLDGLSESGPAARDVGASGRSVQAIESGPVSDEASSLEDSTTAPPSRWWSWPAAVAFGVAVAATAVAWRSLGAALRPEGWGVTGPEVATTTADASSMWASWASGWSGTGLGQAGQGPLWYLPLGVWTWLAQHAPGGPDAGHSAAVATAWLLLAAVPLSTLTAYRASRRALPSRWPRAVLALGWASLAPLAGAVDDGRLGPAVVHIIAPLIVAGVLTSSRRGRAGTSAAFGTVVLITMGSIFVPILLVVGIVSGVIVGCAAPGWSRLRGVLLAMGPFALLGPEMLDIVSDPVLALGGAGATAAGEPAISAATALMLHPGGPISLVLWWLLPAWLLVVLGVADPGRTGSGRPAMWLSLVALAGIAAAMATSRLVVGQVPVGYGDAGAAITSWSGSMMSMAGAAVLLAAAYGVHSVIEARSTALAGGGRSATALAAAGCSVALAIGAASVVATTAVHSISGAGTRVSVASSPLPAVVAERAAGPERVRLIMLSPQAAGQDSQGYVIGYTVVSDEPTPWLRDRIADLVAAGRGPGDSSVLSSALMALADDTDTAVIDPDPLEESLAALAVGYVSVHADPNHPVVDQLDRLPTLIRVNSVPGEELWRVGPAVVGSRIAWQDRNGEHVDGAATRGVHASGGTPVPANAAFMAVAEPSGWISAARVSVDGEVITAEDSASPRYALPPSAQQVRIELPTPHAAWWWASLVGAILALLLSAPLLAPRRRW
ncbi:MAG: hypothetical protein WBG57_14145 [Ornithinimicrobium sp.]